MNKIQRQHIFRNIIQRFSNIKVGVIGGYHGGNLGDIALGESVLEVLEENTLTSGLQTIYNLSKWPKSLYAIIGGGAVGYNDSLKKVVKRYKNSFGNVSLLGVDFNEEVYSEDNLLLLKNSAFISCRSERQAEKLKKITNRNDILFHPDISFSLRNKFCAEIRNTPSKSSIKKLFVNVVPLYAIMKDGQVLPSPQYKNERPFLYENFDTMQNSYKNLLRTLIKSAIQDGYEVETIPFTFQDQQLSKIFFDDLPVKLNDYHSDPGRMLKYMSTASWIISTRYHATIFAMKLGIKFTAIAYAKKNELLLEEAGIGRTEFITTDDLAKGNFTIKQPVKVDNTILDNWYTSSYTAITRSISSLKIE